MPWGIAAGVVGSVAGAAVSGAMAPSTSGGSGSSYYVPSGLPQADTDWQKLNQNSMQAYYDNQGQLGDLASQSLYQGMLANNQYGGAYQNAANSAAGMYSNLAQTQTGQAAQLNGLAGQQIGYAGNVANQAGTLAGQAGLNYGTQQQLLSAGQQVYQNSLDPQSALYNRSAQQLQDQTGATNSMYGLGSSAAGAGVANQAMSNFNIDWNAQQLQNQIAGLGAYTGAANSAGNYGSLGNADLSGSQSSYLNAAQLGNSAASMYNNANSLGSSAAGNTLTGGQLPYQTGQTVGATPGSLANTYGSFLNNNIYQPASNLQSSQIQYMNNGQGAQALPYQNAYNNAQATGGAVGSAIQGIGSAAQNAGGLSNLFSGTTGSFGSGDFSNAFSSSPYYSGGGNSYGFTM